MSRKTRGFRRFKGAGLILHQLSVEDAGAPQNQLVPRPQSVFADGPGWFSCCSLKYVKKTDDPAKNDSFAPSVSGNIVFLIREHPIIVNLHKSADANNPLESFNWLKNVTRDYRGLLLRINGLI